MRQIILDTETTGLDPTLGHRIIEIAAVELVNRRLTDNHFHRYINPERDSEEAALRVHGLTSDFLSDKPKFKEIARDLLEFIRGAELIIHNAAFDLAFIDHELRLLDLQAVTTCCSDVIDTLKMAREIHPGKRNALDSLCERYEIDNSARTLHGALLDAQLLAEVYLAMTRGQESLIMEEENFQITLTPVHVSRMQLQLVVLSATAEELFAHEDELNVIEKTSNGSCLWRKLLPSELNALAA
ncbi:MAG TPA: DNA polymerase III subunit epsilon [Burkholderiales bacterium]|jgi:DNA polymerase-3 subunit epsilon|nr:DNA polymerase III subunit epsilon [Burkholderiales bacterium]